MFSKTFLYLFGQNEVSVASYGGAVRHEVGD